MNPKNALFLLFFCSVSLSAAAPSTPGSHPLPNVIIFIADDMGLGDTSAYQDLTGTSDSEQIDTPELERLAQMGTRFTDAHSNGATCSPARISLLSGTYSFRSPLKTRAVRDNDHVHGIILPGRRTTLAHMLQRSGYRTYGYGKWHIGLRGDVGVDRNQDGFIERPGSGNVYEGPIESGFDTYTGTPGNFSYGGAMIQDKQYMRFASPDPHDYTLVPINHPSAQPWLRQGPERPTDPNLPKVQPAIFEKLQLDLAAHMNSRADDPFFIYYASHSNHDPYVPANYDPQHPDGPRASLNGIVIDPNVTKAGGMIEIVTGADLNGDGIPDPDYAYYEAKGDWIWNDAFRKKWWDHVTEVDASGRITVNGPTNRAMMVQENDIIVGYMLDYLEQTDDPRNPGHKLIDNTIFIFTSDNGADIRSQAAVGALPQSSDGVITQLSGFKGSRWEGGTRIPFIAVWPKPAGRLHAGIPAGATSPALFGLNDIYATLAETIGYKLQADEAVDSESLLIAWTNGLADEVNVVRRGADEGLVYKYQQRLLLRQGELKLAAMDANFDDRFADDRFGDKSGLDFKNMILDTNPGNWRQYIRVLVDLSTNLDERQEGDLGENETAKKMLAVLNALTNRGYSRAGAAAFENGLNFRGGDLQKASNWHAYKPSRSGVLPAGPTPGIIAADGFASGTIERKTLIHRSERLSYRPGKSGALVGSLYELDGGTLMVEGDLRLKNSRLITYRGNLHLGANDLLLEGTDCGLVVSGGTIHAADLSFGEVGHDDGFRIIRFKGGPGTLNLTGAIRFHASSTANDFIDFATGARGRLVTTMDASALALLWDSGHLRINGQIGEPGTFKNSPFQVHALGDNQTALLLKDH
ncbi:MAG: sulfatase-like hydrolase/transferase [Opitutales bacterium]